MPGGNLRIDEKIVVDFINPSFTILFLVPLGHPITHLAFAFSHAAIHRLRVKQTIFAVVIITVLLRVQRIDLFAFFFCHLRTVSQRALLVVCNIYRNLDFDRSLSDIRTSVRNQMLKVI